MITIEELDIFSLNTAAGPFGVDQQMQPIIGGRPATDDIDVPYGSPQASRWPWIVSTCSTTGQLEM